MPELPEVEVTKLRLAPQLTGKQITSVILRTAKLRLPIPPELADILPGLQLQKIERRGKYLLFGFDSGWLVIHLGMTGYLQLLSTVTPPGKHDYADFVFADGQLLRFHDPRKFGTILWCSDDPLRHPLLAGIGPEPLTDAFNVDALFRASRKRKVAIKQFIMDSSVVAGVGNIYANEALFRAHIRPDRAAGTVTLPECTTLVATVRAVLAESVAAGSSYQHDEQGVVYHPLAFAVYGKGGTPCTTCGTSLEEIRLGNRSTVFCPSCQV